MTFRPNPFDNAFPIIFKCLPEEVYITVWEGVESTTPCCYYTDNTEVL